MSMQMTGEQQTFQIDRGLVAECSSVDKHCREIHNRQLLLSVTHWHGDKQNEKLMLFTVSFSIGF